MINHTSSPASNRIRHPNLKSGSSTVRRIAGNYVCKLLLIVGPLLIFQGSYMDIKALLAQKLIETSWHRAVAQRKPTKPWWWADTRAIAKLEVERLEQTVFVMQDESGESLAFGPGHISASAKIAETGHVMIAGHRDSHFQFLRDIQIGDIIELSRYDSKETRYQVKRLRILNADSEELIAYNDDRLTLITCYPFNALIPNGPLRFLVEAQLMEA